MLLVIADTSPAQPNAMLPAVRRQDLTRLYVVPPGSQSLVLKACVLQEFSCMQMVSQGL